MTIMTTIRTAMTTTIADHVPSFHTTVQSISHIVSSLRVSARGWHSLIRIIFTVKMLME